MSINLDTLHVTQSTGGVRECSPVVLAESITEPSRFTGINDRPPRVARSEVFGFASAMAGRRQSVGNEIATNVECPGGCVRLTHWNRSSLRRM